MSNQTVTHTNLEVTFNHVSHRFGSRLVFSNIASTVRQGQILLITGFNGSGKSTLLRIITGLLTPTEGEVKINVNGVDCDAQERRKHIGYVAPDLTLYRELTGVENLTFFGELRGLKLDRTTLASLLSEVGLLGRGNDEVRTYSSGMRQRLKYAFALMHRPAILLLDEPTANLDEAGFGIVEKIVERQINQYQGLAIVATNEPRELSWSSLQVHLEPKQ